ncbi:hypothetical protein [Herbidospora sp. RD11066]
MRITALACVLALSACSAADSSVRPPADQIACASYTCQVGTDPAILVHDLADANFLSLDARLSWLGDTSCLVVALDGLTAVPLWPGGTTPLRAPDGRRGVTVPGRGELLDGDTFTTGGSWVPSNGAATPPAGCGGYDGFFAIDSFSS